MEALKFIVPQIPSISFAAAQHTLGLAPNSSKWDLRTAVTVRVLRNFMNPGNRKEKPPISSVQQRTIAEPGVKGKTWIANATIAKPPASDSKESEGGVLDMREAVFKAVEDMKGEGQELRYTKPDLVDIEVEWTGFRPGAAQSEPLPAVSEEEKYKRLMADTTSEVTILYFHGGAYYLCDPRTHRSIVSRLAKEAGGRACSVRYRLAPQSAFPGQLLDAFMVYLSLLYPPPGSMHEAVPAEKIVFAGDSAGGNLSFALQQLLLQLHRSSSGVPVVRFHGRDVQVPVPAGASANSGWFDLSRSMPSIESNAVYDYLPPAKHDDTLTASPNDELWPTDPPRGDLFCDLSLFDHPLVSLILADSWKDSSPLWFCTGEEMLTDEDIIVAARAARQGVTVHFEQYEAMPHCFQLLIPSLATADRCMRSWGTWARKCVEEPQALRTNGTWITAKSGAEKVVDVVGLKAVEDGEVRRRVQEAKERRMKSFAQMSSKEIPKAAL